MQVSCGSGRWSSVDSPQVAFYRQLFALQAQARELGRSVGSGGGWWRGSYYGFVRATESPYPSAVGLRANPDSWRCHHEHPSELVGVECALREVRRLAAGGEFTFCPAGRECQEAECVRDWKSRDRRLHATRG